MKLIERSIHALIFLVVILFTGMTGQSQPNIAFYPLDEHFNSSTYNPAFLSSREKFTFSIFPFGGTSIGYNNQQIVKELVTGTLQGISTNEEYKNVLKSITNRRSFNQDIESILLTFTLRSKLGFFNFRIRENQSFSVAAKGELTSFIFNKNIESTVINRTQDLPAQALHYREYSIGYSLPLGNSKFTLGFRPKIYFGKAAFFSGLSGSVQNKSSNYILNAGGTVKLSIPLTQSDSGGNSISSMNLTGKNALKYLLNSGNPGFGIDLGFNYRIRPDLTLSMSVMDLGKIEWKTNLNSKVFDGKYSIPEGEVTANSTGDIITKKYSNYAFSDSISNIFEQTVDSAAFSSPMPVTVYAGIKHRVNSRLTISLTDRYVYLKNMNYNSMSLMFGLNLNKAFSVSSGYSMIGNSYSNIPLAFLFRSDFGQMYLGTDNLLSFIVPSFSDFAGFTFGTCFYLFRKKNLSNSKSEDFPFYQQKDHRRDRKTGLIRKEYTDF